MRPGAHGRPEPFGSGGAADLPPRRPVSIRRLDLQDGTPRREDTSLARRIGRNPAPSRRGGPPGPGVNPPTRSEPDRQDYFSNRAAQDFKTVNTGGSAEDDCPGLEGNVGQVRNPGVRFVVASWRNRGGLAGDRPGPAQGPVRPRNTGHLRIRSRIRWNTFRRPGADAFSSGPDAGPSAAVRLTASSRFDAASTPATWASS